MRLLLFFIILTFKHIFAHSSFDEIYYVHPPDAARRVTPETNIIIKSNGKLDDFQIEARGSLSGRIDGKMKLLSDDEILLFQPLQSLRDDEQVTISLRQQNKAKTVTTFHVSDNSAEIAWPHPEPEVIRGSSQSRITNGVRTINGVPVPSDFPDIRVNLYGETAPGRIFFGSTFTEVGNYLVILENDGTPYFYRKYIQDDRGSGEFKVQPNGLLTAYLFVPQFFIALDEHFAEVDTFQCLNGYGTDPHEMLMLENGNVLLIAKHPQLVDMSKIVDGGNPNASVMGNHVQEHDPDGNVVFEWRCWDHFNITDAVHENLTARYIDYIHMNSIAVDYDGHLVISSRHLSEVTKINHDTGEIIWRLGGVNNQFEFINDPIEISYQHHVRPVPGVPNQYTIYDNGNHRNPRFTRAVQYKLDVARKTAEKVWEFRYTPDRYAFMLGNVQRLENGNTFINWSTWPPLFACEVDADGNVVYELEAGGNSSNRVRRYRWDGFAKVPYLIAESQPHGVVLIYNKFGDENVKEYIVYAGKDTTTFTPVDTTTIPYTVLNTLDNNAYYFFKVRAIDKNGRNSDFSNKVGLLVKYRESGENLLQNGDFLNDSSGWQLLSSGDAQVSGEVKEGEFHVNISEGGSQYYNVQLIQENVPLIRGHQYEFQFDAYADGERIIEPKIAKNGEPYTNYSKTNLQVITRQKRQYTYSFTMDDPSDNQARLVLNCGLSDVNCYFDNVAVKEISETSTIQKKNPTVNDFALMPNYPNPFNPVTTIHYNIGESSHVTLVVYNLRGEIVESLANSHHRPGNYQVIFDGSQQASGLYLYHLQASSSTSNGRYSETRKMMLIR